MFESIPKASLGKPELSGNPIAVKGQGSRVGLLSTSSATFLIQSELGPILWTKYQMTAACPYILRLASRLRL
ncbi:MAG: hypothetical protein D3903_14405 [Candidatus Electrothrix sp. GM3_4]|nr:hypothetical protein [Candidatus Electrothrix sp. GM3_4]